MKNRLAAVFSFSIEEDVRTFFDVVRFVSDYYLGGGGSRDFKSDALALVSPL